MSEAKNLKDFNPFLRGYEKDSSAKPQNDRV